MFRVKCLLFNMFRSPKIMPATVRGRWGRMWVLVTTKNQNIETLYAEICEVV